ncbi:6750_t:CDS:2, partial [Cetraspora pellucida]
LTNAQIQNIIDYVTSNTITNLSQSDHISPKIKVSDLAKSLISNPSDSKANVSISPTLMFTSMAVLKPITKEVSLITQINPLFIAQFNPAYSRDYCRVIMSDISSQIENADNHLSQDCIIKIFKFPEEKDMIIETLNALYVRMSIHIEECEEIEIVSSLPEIRVSTPSSPQIPKISNALMLLPFKKMLSKEKHKEVINKLTMHFTNSPKLDLYFSIDKEGKHQVDAYWVLGSFCPLCRKNHMSLQKLGISLDNVLEAYPKNSKLIQELKTQCYTLPIP